MLYLFAGDDAQNKLEAYDSFIKSIPEGTEIFFVNHNSFNKMEFERFYSGAGLFFSKSAIFCENIFEREEMRDFILTKLDQIKDSENIFVFLEGRLNKPVLDAFRKARAELNIFELPKEKKEKFDNFLLANAFGDRDKLNLWIYFRQAIDKGVGMEELIGVLFWKIKDMILKRNFSKFSEEELKGYVTKISYLLPEARKNGRDAESAFEQFLLEAF